MYAWRGYETRESPEPPEALTTLIARGPGKRTLATLSIRLDETAPMAVETLYPDEVTMLRASGATLCEFTRLAVDQTEHSLDVLASAFHAAFLYARRLRRRSDLLVEVNPRHASFYRQMLGFRQLGPQRLCPRVNAPAVLLWLPLRYAEDQISRFGGKGLSAGVRSLYPRFLAPQEEPALLAELAPAIAQASQPRPDDRSARPKPR